MTTFLPDKQRLQGALVGVNLVVVAGVEQVELILLLLTSMPLHTRPPLMVVLVVVGGSAPLMRQTIDATKRSFAL